MLRFALAAGLAARVDEVSERFGAAARSVANSPSERRSCRNF